jgi:hypothetical protein
MSATHNLRKIETEVSMLSQEDQLRLLERLVHRLRIGGAASKKRIGWDEMYGIAANRSVGVDAQEYVNQLREDR